MHRHVPSTHWPGIYSMLTFILHCYCYIMLIAIHKNLPKNNHTILYIIVFSIGYGPGAGGYVPGYGNGYGNRYGAGAGTNALYSDKCVDSKIVLMSWQKDKDHCQTHVFDFHSAALGYPYGGKPKQHGKRCFAIV